MRHYVPYFLTTGHSLRYPTPTAPEPHQCHSSDSSNVAWILGATGSGKSELIARMIPDDARACLGMVMVDPKGASYRTC